MTTRPRITANPGARALVLALTLLGCGGDDDDTQTDAGQPAPDAGQPAPDAGQGDSGSPAADAGQPDAGSGAVIPTFNGCPSASFQDRSAASAARTITIEDSLTYTPKCMIIAAGQTVRWEGSLANHPLDRGNKASLTAGSPNSPIVATSSGSSVQFTFATPGTYPYHCTVHDVGAGTGMAGVVHVR